MRTELGVLGALWLLTACAGGGSGSGGGMTVRDSAGLRIVENRGEGWTDDGWRLVEPAAVQIGGSEEDVAYDVGRPFVALLEDGRIAIGNGQSFDVRLYDSTGRHLTTVGRRGGGPGEYQSLFGIYRGSGDSLLVLDLAQRRLTVLGPAGEFVRTFGLGGQAGAITEVEGRVSLAAPIGWLADGSVPGSAQVFTLNDMREGTYRDTMAVVRFGPDGAARDTIGTFPGIELQQITMTFGTQSGRAPSGVPLGRNTIMAAAGDRVAIAPNEAHWEVQIRGGTGRVIHLIRRLVDPVRISEADIRAHREEQLELIANTPEMRAVPQELRQQFEARINQASYPATYAWIGGLRFDDRGHLWVQEVARPGTEVESHLVFDAEGALLGRVTMPRRFRLMDVRGDRVAGVWRDENDVEYVRVYRMSR